MLINTGIVRPMDELGRILIPKGARVPLNWHRGDTRVRVYVNEESQELILKAEQLRCACCGTDEDLQVLPNEMCVCKKCLARATSKN